jgi:hypothetical protein
MSGSPRIGRRGFFVAALGLAATTLAGRFGPKRETSDDDTATDAARLMRAFSCPESAAALGRAYLSTAPWEGSPTVLVKSIAASLPAGYLVLRTADEKQLESQLARQLKEDFTTGNTVIVDGWIVAKTEARLYALAAFFA